MPRAAAALGLTWVLCIGAAFAEQAPDLLVKQTTDKALGELTANREALLENAGMLYEMVDQIVLPHFDFERMSKLVLGKYWKQANAEQRLRFQREFKSLLVRTYATALFEYTGQEIIYKPYRPKKDSERALVQTEFVPGDGPNIPVDYALKKGGDGAWRVYDVRIDQVSMVINYREAYKRIIESKGIDSLIASLGEKREMANQQ